jgi:3-hydroxyisobutyrate dehydrogenase
MKIAFLGTGLMGEPMAQRLLAAGHHLNVFNRTTLKTEKLCANGAVLAFHPYDAIVQAEIVITMLSDFTAVCEVLCPNKKNNFAGKLVIQMSTISPDESLLLKERIELFGGEYLEAPVLGSIPQATDGSLQIMVGSSAQQFEKIKNILEAMGKQILRVGDVGAASAIKLALNQLIATTVASFSMSLGYLKEKEVDLKIYGNIARQLVVLHKL